MHYYPKYVNLCIKFGGLTDLPSQSPSIELLKTTLFQIIPVMTQLEFRNFLTLKKHYSNFMIMFML